MCVYFITIFFLKCTLNQTRDVGFCVSPCSCLHLKILSFIFLHINIYIYFVVFAATVVFYGSDYDPSPLCLSSIGLTAGKREDKSRAEHVYI